MLLINANNALPIAITENVATILQNTSLFAKSQMAKIHAITLSIIQVVII